jgi:hypothetical protein
MATKKRVVAEGDATVNPFGHLMNSAINDEAFRKARPYGSGASVTRDGGFDKQLEQFETQTWMSHDPMSEALAAAKAENPGHAFRFLSDRVCQRNGMRGFKPVIAKNGDPVSVAGLKLAYMPQEYADQRTAHYRDEYREQMENAANSYQETQDRMIAQAGAVESFGTLKPGSVIDDSTNPGSSASIGLTRMRGGHKA